MPVISNSSSKNTNIRFLCSSSLELIASLHVLSDPHHHTSCDEWYRRIISVIDQELKERILSFGNRFNQWSFIMDLVDVVVPGIKGSDFDQVADRLQEMSIVDFAYVFLGATLIKEKSTAARLLMNPESIEDHDLNELKKYISEENILFFLKNPELVRTDLIAIFQNFRNACFEEKWQATKNIYYESLSEEKRKFERSDTLSYILGLHKDLSCINNTIIMKKQTDFQMSAEEIKEIRIYFSLFTFPHLMINIYEDTLSIYKNLMMPQVTDTCERISTSTKAFCDVTRLSMLKILVRGSSTNKELANYLQMTPASISQHLKILKELGIVATERDKNNILYSINKENLRKIMRELGEFLELD